MATQIQVTGKIVQNLDGGPNQINFSNLTTTPGYNPSGSQGFAGIANITTTATLLPTGSCQSFGMLAFVNTCSSSIIVYSDGATATKPVTILQASQSSGPIWWSGSASGASGFQFSAKTVLPATPGTLHVMFNEF